MKYCFLFIIFLFNFTFANVWVDPTNGESNFSYVYAPGMSSSETQLAKYCPKFIASTGETVTCDRGIETIQDTVCAATFAEVNLKSDQEHLILLKKLAQLALISPICYLVNKYAKDSYKSIFNNITIPVFLSYAFWNQLNFAVFYLANKRLGIDVKRNNSNQASYSVLCHYINLFKINVGQEDDINILKQKVEENLKKQKAVNNKIILYGVSRGSATTFSYFALHDFENIAAVICEGIFDSLNNIIKYGDLFSKFKIGILKNSKITKFDSNGLCPMKTVNQINKDKPMAIITSIKDEVVPCQCTLNLYKQLLEHGCDKVHILILKKSKHNLYPIDTEKESYQNFIHAFYKNYNLPYIEEYANKGQELFKQSQPTIDNINELLASL